tara:strand:- start:254 stop:487 length:234 start_codon:yes stop_codon:yes gene_type:complete
VSLSESLHIAFDWDEDSILSVSDDQEGWHPDATYWLPTQNIDRFLIYLDLNKLSKLECKKHLQRLVAGRIVQRTNKP